MKKHLSTIFFVLMFLTGLSVLLYPAVSNYVNTRSQSKAVNSYVDHMMSLDASTNDALLREAEEYNKSIRSQPNRFAVDGDALNAYLQMLGAADGAVGYLEIGAIDVNLPIYLGNSTSALREGVGTMPGSSLPIGGPGTHAVLTGHRGLPSSWLLTDLNQMAVGDSFVLHVLNKTLVYEVDQIRVVEPYDLTELEIQPDQDLCTLVTCTPYGINSHRMLVRGHRIEPNGLPDRAENSVAADAVRIEPVTMASCLAVLFLLALFLIRMIQKHKKS